MSRNSSQSQWKDKFHTLLNSAGSELKRTTAIGIKLVSASQANSQLHEKMEELGKLAAEKMEAGQLQWSDDKAQDILGEIKKLQATLEAYEEDVQHIKNSDKAD